MAFVHLHNHTDFSMLDGATRVEDMVARAVELGMPAVAITDHGNMCGVPALARATDAVNHAEPDYDQWFHDKDNLEKGRPVEEPDASDERRHAQWEADMACHEAGRPLDEVKPKPRVKPIFGCEVYFTPDSELRRDRKPEYYHMILLAKNETGYVNLMKIVSDAATRGFYYKPRVTLEMLQEHSEGVICTSACVAGIIPRNIMTGNPGEALRWAKTFKETFAPGDFYLEVQEHGLDFSDRFPGWTDRRLTETLLEMAKTIGVKVVATNDFHYLTRTDAAMQDVVSCIGMGKTLDDTNRMQMTQNPPGSGQGEFYMKSEEEMRALFDWCPEVCDNTLEIADKCDFELDWTHMYLPKFPGLAEGETSEERFRKECEEGLAKRYGDDWREREIGGESILERFEYEYKVICEKGFADYFLIVQEYVQWAKDHGIGVGPGRGSAAGAIVAYAMNITTFDPLENGLMFERFLSPERSEMPDIDMDFDDERRLEVVQHVRELYGPERVCHVITFSTIKAKQAINDANRVLGKPVYMGQKLSKMVSGDPKAKLKMVLDKTPGKEDLYSPDFADAYGHDPESKDIIDTALSIEGLTRGEGVHACAVLIAPTPVNDHVPTKLDTKGGFEITQYEGHDVADMGLLKMDFLGLRTLTVISKALANIRANHGTAADAEAAPEAVRATLKEGSTGVDIDVDKIPFDDPAIFDLMGRGHTAGVFQVESGGMTATIKSMQPKEYRQVVALIALYRPGPLGAGMVDSYINRMNGREPVAFYDERLSDILDETYGTMVYQEQVMKISVKMSGFSAGESDSRIRKPVAKKKIKLLTSTVFHWDDGADETTYDHWVNGAVKNGYKREVAQKIWDDVLEFASYAFNKSHSAGYAILVMQTAWLKAYYPREYMAAVLTSYTGKTEKIVHYIGACRQEGIDVLPPDVNESGIEFTAVPEGIRIGLAGIRGVGEGAAELILKERAAGGPFATIHEFCDRVDTTQVNRRVIEALIKAGAFDSTGYTRKQLAHFVDKANPENILDAAVKRQKDRAAGQVSFFDMFADVADSGFASDVPEPDGEEWDRTLKLSQEKEVLGIYVSDHPLRPYEYALTKARSYSIGEVLNGYEHTADDGVTEMRAVDDERTIWLAGMASTVQKRTTKKGDPMAIVTLEDMENKIDVVVFPKTYSKCASLLFPDEDGDIFLRIEGRVDRSDRGDQFMAQSVEPLLLDDEANRPKTLEVLMPAEGVTKEFLSALSRSASRHGGLDSLELYVAGGAGLMRLSMPVTVDAQSVVLYAEVAALVDAQGKVQVA